MLEAVACIRPAAAGLRVLAQVRVRALQRLPAHGRVPISPRMTAQPLCVSQEETSCMDPCAWMRACTQQACMSKAQLPLGRLARMRARHPLSNVANGRPLNSVLLCATQPSLFRPLRPFLYGPSQSATNLRARPLISL